MKESSKIFSIIDAGFNVEGSVSGKGRLVIKGSIKGTIAGQQVVIAEEGNVQAEARVDEITIGGIYQGRIQARGTVTVLATGRCSGDIKCHDLVVEPGGMLNASVTVER